MVDPGTRCLPDVLRAWSDTHPNKPALIASNRVVTYAQLDDRSNRIGNVNRPGNPGGS